MVREVAEKAARRITRKVIATLQQMTDRLSGDDSGLKTTWDEICAQLQCEKSFYWDACDETVKRIVGVQVAALPRHEREAIWLQTDPGIDWNSKEIEDGEEPPILDGDVVDWIAEEHVYTEAANWSNARVRAYVERLTIDD
jgi:hypothetical protein